MKIRKLISVFAAVLLGLCLCLSFVACVPQLKGEPIPEYVDKESGDFMVRFYESYGYCEILGTSEQGNAQKYLVVPESIEGLEVKSWGEYWPLGFIMMPGRYQNPDIESTNLEKIYFKKLKNYSTIVSSSSCPNLDKLIYLDFFSVPWGFNEDIYFPFKRYETLKAYSSSDIRALPANVSYYYNYENPKNGGYYWIDDCDYGGKIEFIPPEPEREGYEFDGWYKEPECINKWDFETDTLPEKQTEMQENLYGEEEEVTVYQETILYAGWIKTDSPDNC